MVKYPSKSEELDIMRSVTNDEEPELKEVVDGSTILEFQHLSGESRWRTTFSNMPPHWFGQRVLTNRMPPNS